MATIRPGIISSFKKKSKLKDSTKFIPLYNLAAIINQKNR